MSDFLTGLVQRHEKSASLVRPRLPSLFETATPAVRPAITPDEAAPELREEHSFFEAAQPAPRAIPQPAMSAAPVQHPIAEKPSPFMAPPRETVTPTSRAPAQERKDIAAPAAAPQPPEPVQPVARRKPLPVRAIETVEEQDQRQIVEHHVEHTTQIETRTLVTEAPRPIAPREPATVRDAQPQPAAPFAPPPEQPRPSAPPFEAAQVSPRPPSRAQARREAREAQRAEMEPVIHVSIGRIEVRAVEERETRARKSDAPSPVMPLDEYLRSRAKR